MKFFSGTHHPHWLARTTVPLFLSHRRLLGGDRPRRSLPRALGEWALDSGGFTELSMFGEWRTSPRDYALAARRYRDEIGGLLWCAPQDWMCEPIIINGGVMPGGRVVPGTHLSVREHQIRTIVSVIELRSLAPDVPWIPVLQGWELAEYLTHVAMYTEAGIDLAAEPVVGVGSVCRRHSTADAAAIFSALSALDLRLHGFGVKGGGLGRYGDLLVSADSMAWSFSAWRQGNDDGRPLFSDCTHKNCANCLPYMLVGRADLLHPLPDLSRINEIRARRARGEVVLSTDPNLTIFDHQEVAYAA